MVCFRIRLQSEEGSGHGFPSGDVSPSGDTDDTLGYEIMNNEGKQGFE